MGEFEKFKKRANRLIIRLEKVSINAAYIHDVNSSIAIIAGYMRKVEKNIHNNRSNIKLYKRVDRYFSKVDSFLVQIAKGL